MLARRPTRPARNATLVAALATVVWGGSAFVGIWYGDGETWDVRLAGGALVFNWGELPKQGIIRWRFADGFNLVTGGPELLWIPFRYRWGVDGLIALPLWPIPATLVARAVWRWRRSPRSGPGLCRTCGYDLSGNVSGVCPECGNATADKRATLPRSS